MHSRSVPMEEASKSFSGVALMFEPSEHFERTDTKPSPLKLIRAAIDAGLMSRIFAVSLWLQLLALPQLPVDFEFPAPVAPAPPSRD